MPLTPDDVDLPPPPSEGKTDRVVALAERLRTEERAVITATKALQNALNAYNRTAEVELPDAMRDAGVSEWPLRLLDGKPVKLESKLRCGKLTSDEGLDYVEANGGEAVVKTYIEIELGKGDLPAARELLRELQHHRLANQFHKLVLDRHVHPQTLGAWVREKIEQGEMPDLDVLGVHRWVRAVLGVRKPKEVSLTGMAER